MLSLTRKIEGIERAEIAAALQKAGWVKARAARMLGITERMIGYKIKKYDIKREVVESNLGEPHAATFCRKSGNFKEEQ